MLKAGVRYLIATGHGQPRTYRVSAILDLRPLPETVTRPDSFDLADFWRAHVGRYERAGTDQVAEVRLTPNGVTAVPDVLGPKAARLALRTLTPAEPDGWQRATIPMENVPRMRWVNRRHKAAGYPGHADRMPATSGLRTCLTGQSLHVVTRPAG